jgi:hypothetical protein
MNSQPTPATVECPFCGLFNAPTASRCKCGKRLAVAWTPPVGTTRSEIDYLRSINSSLSAIKYILVLLLLAAVTLGIVYTAGRFPSLFR